MLRFARVWFLLAMPFWALARTDLVEEWTPFAWTLFYIFLGFGAFSMLLSLFEDSAAKIPKTAVEPAPAEIIQTLTEPTSAMAAVPAPVVALAISVSTVALASSAALEVPGPLAGPGSVEGASASTAV